jgi:hypothetical protein
MRDTLETQPWMADCTSRHSECIEIGMQGTLKMRHAWNGEANLGLSNLQTCCNIPLDWR